MKNFAKPLAPYSHIAKPIGLGLFVLAGPGSMQQAKYRNAQGMAALAITGDMAPDSFRWPVMGFEITLINMGLADDYIEVLVHTLLRSGASLVVIVSKWDTGASVHRREELSNAA